MHTLVVVLFYVVFLIFCFVSLFFCFFVFFFNDTATTEIYTLSLHDALPICRIGRRDGGGRLSYAALGGGHRRARQAGRERSGEDTSEIQSRLQLVCRLFL